MQLIEICVCKVHKLMLSKVKAFKAYTVPIKSNNMVLKFKKKGYRGYSELWIKLAVSRGFLN